MDPLIMSQVL